MTNEEVERAIDFLLRSQANLEAKVEQTSQQLTETVKQLNEFADMQTEFIQVVTRTFEAQARINETLAAGQARINETLAASQARTDEALARLAEAQANSDRRLDALIDIVQSGRSGQ
jgi:chromosome segregation ATPase